MKDPDKDNKGKSYEKKLNELLEDIYAKGLNDYNALRNDGGLYKLFLDTLCEFLLYEAFEKKKIAYLNQAVSNLKGSADIGTNGKRGSYEEDVNRVYVKLFSKIKKGRNRNRVFIDTLFEKPAEAFVPNIYSYIANNIYKDALKRDDPDYLERRIINKSGESFSVGDNQCSKDDIEKSVQSDEMADEIWDDIVNILKDHPDELMAYALKLSDDGLKSSGMVEKMRRSGSHEKFFRETIKQFGKEFHVAAERSIDDISNLKRVERLFSMSDQDAARELSRCASRAGQKVRSKSTLLSDDELKK